MAFADILALTPKQALSALFDFSFSSRSQKFMQFARGVK
jgi:hypothetical protein